VMLMATATHATTADDTYIAGYAAGVVCSIKNHLH
jgi:hypothetical protein